MKLRGALIPLALMMAGTVQAAAQPDAVSVQERYGEWVVSCKKAGTAKNQCVVMQVQMKNNVRLLSAELAPDGNEAVTGRLVLPFGFDVSKDLALSADNMKLPALTFSTCLPEGCVVPVKWKGKELKALADAAEWTIRGTAAYGGEEAAEIKATAAGLKTALARAAELMEQ